MIKMSKLDDILKNNNIDTTNFKLGSEMNMSKDDLLILKDIIRTEYERLNKEKATSKLDEIEMEFIKGNKNAEDCSWVGKEFIGRNMTTDKGKDIKVEYDGENFKREVE